MTVFFHTVSLLLVSVAAIFQTDCYYHSLQVPWGGETVELDPQKPGKPVTASNKCVYRELLYIAHNSTDLKSALSPLKVS